MIDIEKIGSGTGDTYQQIKDVVDYNDRFYNKDTGDRVTFYYKDHWRETYHSSIRTIA